MADYTDKARIELEVDDITEAVAAFDRLAASMEGAAGAEKTLKEARKKAREEAKADAAARKAAAEQAKAAAGEAKARAKEEAAERRRLADAAKEQAKSLAFLEKAYYSALTPSEKNAVLLANLHRLDLTAITDAKARAEAEKMRASAIAQVTKKMEDQSRREKENRGRSLSMLFDEQNKLLALLPGRMGEYAAKVAGLKAAGTEAAAGLAAMKVGSEAGFASVTLLGAAVAGAALGAGLLGAAALKMGADGAEAADKLIELAEVTGLSAEQLSRYQVLAEKGLPSEDIGKLAEGFQKLNMAQANARGGNDEMQAALDRLGVSGATAEERFLSLADGYSKSANSAQRSADLTRILGDGLARELAPALALGADGIRKLTAENDAYGRTLDADAIRLTNDYQDAQKELRSAVRGLETQMIGLTPVLAAGFKVLEGGIGVLGGGIKIVNNFASGLSFFATTLGTMITEAKGWNEAADQVAAGLVADAEAAERGAKANAMAAEAATMAAEQAAAKAAADEKAAEAAKKHAERMEEMRGVFEDIRKRTMPALTLEVEEQRRQLEELAAAYRAGAISASEFAYATGALQAEMLATRIQMEAETQGRLTAFRDAELEGVKTLTAEQMAQFKDYKDSKDLLSQAAHESEMARIAAEKAARIEAARTTAASVVSGLEATAVLIERFGKDREKAELRAFRLRKAAAIAQISITTIEAAAKVFAALAAVPPVAAIAAAAVIASGALQVAAVASEPPPQTSHAGGVVTSGPRPAGGMPLEVMNRQEVGEGIVSRADMNGMGGGPGLNSLLLAKARGGGVQPMPVTVLGQRALGRGVRTNYLAGGAVRDLVRGKKIVGMNTEV